MFRRTLIASRPYRIVYKLLRHYEVGGTDVYLSSFSLQRPKYKLKSDLHERRGAFCRPMIACRSDYQPRSYCRYKLLCREPFYESDLCFYLS